MGPPAAGLVTRCLAHGGSDGDIPRFPWPHPAGRGSDIVDSPVDAGRRCREQNEDTQSPAGKVLLAPGVLVRGDQQLVAVLLRSIEQVAIARVGPPLLEGGVHRVSGETPPEGRRRALIEQYLHDRAGFARAFTSWSRTTATAGLSTPGNHSRNCSTDAPSLRFSKRAATGALVPRNTQAPLSLSG